MRFGKIAVAMGLALGGLLLTGCADDDQMAANYVERPIEQIYSDGWILINRQDWLNAGRQFDEVERQHPYSVWARRAVLMSAYCYYEGNRYEQKTEDALTALQDLIQRFPDTEYARDARLKVDLTRDHLAGREMTIGRFYLRQGEYIAAINRFHTVIDKYQTTTHAPEALERLTEAYLALGVVKEAQTSAAVLGYNYPGSRWYMDAYGLLTENNVAPSENEESWISKAFRTVF
jgi:outer membrane protein assembly factor BamD